MTAVNSTIPLPFTHQNKARKWLTPSDAPKSINDLTFTSRDDQGRLKWWDVTPPKTDYWHVHHMLGRAYAFELLDLVHNPEAETSGHSVGHVCRAIGQWSSSAGIIGTAATGIADGFFEVLSEFIVTGKVSR